MSHFTNAEGATGITSIVAERLVVGQQVIVRRLQFAHGVNSFLAHAPGDLFVTELGPEVTSGQLGRIGVFGAKQHFVIRFSEEAAFRQGARVRGADPERSIYTIPGGISLTGGYDYMLMRVR